MTFLRFALAGALLLSLHPGCVDGSVEDPDGTWMLSETWGLGDCELTGSEAEAVTVAGNAPSYTLTVVGAESANPTGVIRCDSSSCDLTMSVTLPGTDAPSTYALHLDGDAITGSGSKRGHRVSDGAACGQQFSAVGTRQ